jgi:hypothetical protein
MVSSRTCCPTCTLSFDSVVCRAGCESLLIGYNYRLGLELRLTAVLKSRSRFVVQWHCLVLRDRGYSRPVMILLRSCMLRIRAEIRRKPEIHIVHINSSHSEKLYFLIDSPRKIEIMISWALSERYEIYIPVLSPLRSAHLPHKTTVVLRRTSPSVRLTQTEAARRMKIPSFSCLLLHPTIQLCHRF